MYGQEIKKARDIKGATQLQVSKATGLPQNTISWIELDKGIPNIQQCVLLAQYYGCTIDELVGLSDKDAMEYAQNNSTPTKIQPQAVAFEKDFGDMFTDKNYIDMSKLYKAISPELRALTLGYIVGILQNNGINTKFILGY